MRNLSGEFPIVVNAYAQRVEKEKQKGAPIEWVPVNPVVFHSQGIMLGKHARHPNTGKLFIDFILSLDGQKIIRDRKRIPTRSDVPPDPPRLVKGLKFKPRPNKYIADNYAELEKQFYDIVKGR